METLLIAGAALWLWLRFRASQGQGAAPNQQPAFQNDPSTQVAAYSPNLPYAVAEVESGGRQYDSSGNVITSSAGALGIMQLLPGTARGLGVDPYDADQNFQGGSTYLDQLIAKYGDVDTALAAYNWGPGNVDRALANGSSFPSSVQSYIAKVKALL